jgi:hypothetical protein
VVAQQYQEKCKTWANFLKTMPLWCCCGCISADALKLLSLLEQAPYMTTKMFLKMQVDEL